MSVILTATGIVFTLYGLLLLLVSNITMGLIMTISLGLFILFCGIFYKKIKEKTKNGIYKYIKILVLTLICVEILFASFLGVYSVFDNAEFDEDVCLVLGAGLIGENITWPLKLRLDKAIEYHEKNPESLIVVSGGKGQGETVTEALAMEKYLLQHNIDKNKIIKEEKATSTKENMLFSKEILDNRLKSEYDIVVITNNFHIFRGVALAKDAGFTEVRHLHAGLKWYNVIPCYLRETLALIKMWVLG